MAVALSLVLHALLLWSWPREVSMRPFDDPRKGEPGGSLVVRMAPPAAPAIRAQPAPAQRPAASRAAQRPASAPRLLASERASASNAIAPRPAEAAPAPASEDLASYVEARRRAREPVPVPPPQPPMESEQERDNRAVAVNLGLLRAPSFGTERNRGGGTFQMVSIGYDHAAFAFYGWNKSIERISLQTIEVRRGSNASMELAVVRRMIALIREQSSGDFRWESQRLHRDLWLSARLADNLELENFMMGEFFPDLRLRH